MLTQHKRLIGKSTGWDLNPGKRICNPRRSRSDTRAVIDRLRAYISTQPIPICRLKSAHVCANYPPPQDI